MVASLDYNCDALFCKLQAITKKWSDMKKLLLLLVFIWSTLTYGSELRTIPLNDGESIVGRLSLPSTTDNVPLVVVFVPGTGPNTYLNKRKISKSEFNYYDLFETEFNKRGIGFFTYNRRGVEIGDNPPYYDKIDSAKYAKYTPKREVLDIESILADLRKVDRLKNARIVLLGASEGTIIAAMVAERMVEQVDGLLLFGYANDNMLDIIKWQLSGAASMINLRTYFDRNNDNVFSRAEYESTDSIASLGRVRVLKEYFQLEANKTRLLNIDIPISIFQGVDDANTPVEGVYDIQSRFKQANKTNLKCFIFEGHNHDLNYLDWPFKQQISEGLNAIFNTAELLIK